VGVDAQRVRNIRTAIQVVHIQRANRGDAAFNELATVGTVRISLAFAKISPVSVFTMSCAQHLALHVFGGHRQTLDARLLEFLDVARRDAAAFFDNDLLADADLERGGFAAQTLRDDFEFDFFLRQMEHVLVEEDVEDLLFGQPQRAQDDGSPAIWRRRSMRANTQSFGSNSKSSHEPRYGMMRAENNSLPDEWVLPRS